MEDIFLHPWLHVHQTSLLSNELQTLAAILTPMVTIPGELLHSLVKKIIGHTKRSFTRSHDKVSFPKFKHPLYVIIINSSGD